MAVSTTTKSQLKTVAAYLLATLLIGFGLALLFLIASSVAHPDEASTLAQQITYFGFLFLFSVPMTLGLGGAQALFVGIGSALQRARGGYVPLALPLGLAVIAWIAFSVIGRISDEPGRSLDAIMFSSSGAFFLVIHLAAAALGWRIDQRFAV
jgi:hypothetical protein